MSAHELIGERLIHVLVLDVSSAGREWRVVVTTRSRVCELPAGAMESSQPDTCPEGIALSSNGKGVWDACDPSASAVTFSGLQPRDAGEQIVLERQAIEAAASPEAGRRLTAAPVRFPTHERHILAGDIPSSYDPRKNSAKASCYEDVPVVDQGGCGSCYAAAFAQMLSIRLCEAELGPDASVDCAENKKYKHT